MRLLTIILFIASPLYATTYYVSASGSNANAGTSQALAWRTPNRLNAGLVYQPGDSILFRRGDTFEGQINVKLEGTPSNPIVIGAYGTGDRPIIYGDMRRDIVWTKTPGTTGIYQAYTGDGTVMANDYCHQFVGGAWTKLNGIEIRPSDANKWAWPAWYDSLKAGEFGRSYTADTLFVHTYGNAIMPATRDSIRMVRNANMITSGSHDAIIRDLDIRNINYAIEVSEGTNITLRKLNAHKSMLLGIAFNGCVNSLIDSCSADSGGSTQFYIRASTRCKIRYNTARDVLIKVDSIAVSGDKCAVGIQGPYYAGMDWSTGYGYNTVEYNTFTNAGPIDFWYNVGDTIQYNILYGGIGIYPHGTNIVIKGNTVIYQPNGSAGIMHGMNMGTGKITVTGNTFLGTGSAWLWLENDSSESGGTFEFSNNVVTRNAANSTIIHLGNEGMTSFNNKYFGLGNYSSWKSATNYSTLSAFQAASGFEAGSTWSATYNGELPEGVTNPPPSEPTTTWRRLLLFDRNR